MSALSDAEKLSQPMGQFEAWYGKLFCNWPRPAHLDSRYDLGFLFVKNL